MSETVDVLGIPFARCTPDDALAAVGLLYERAAPAFVVHANVHTVNLAFADEGYRDVLERADLVLNDGKGIMLAGLVLGRPFPADLNGNFFAPRLLEMAAERGWGVYFLGARRGVAERAAARLRDAIPSLDVVGCDHGYFGPDDEDEVCARVRASGAGLLLVGLGNPAQERFIARRLLDTGARVAVGVGAFFDFTSGEVERAPAWMNRLGLEWVHRLAKEPRRMWRRYIVGNPLFVWRVVKSRLGSQPPTEGPTGGRGT